MSSIDDKLHIDEQNKNYVYLEQLQDEVLYEFSKIEHFPFIFTAGTALTKVHLSNHRRSYDLDFFGKLDNIFKFSVIDSAINSINAKIEKKGTEEDIRIKDMTTYVISKKYNNEDVVMKIDFVNDCFYGLFHTIQYKGCATDSIDAIYFRKIYAIICADTSRIKDLIDIFHLNNHHELGIYCKDVFVPTLNKYYIDNNLNDVIFKIEKIREALDIFLKYIFHNEFTVKELLDSYDCKLDIYDIHDVLSCAYREIQL